MDAIPARASMVASTSRVLPSRPTNRSRDRPAQGGARRLRTACGLSLAAPKFSPEKLSVTFLGGEASGFRRRYTLTHNDITGRLFLSVGSDYNTEQVSGWYTRLLRDEVLADWCDGGLHVHCHVKGHADWWLAPSVLRLFIFRREMNLVLDAFRYADSSFLEDSPDRWDTPVYVHFHNFGEGGESVVESWGTLGAPFDRGRVLDPTESIKARLCSPAEDVGARRSAAGSEGEELCCTGEVAGPRLSVPAARAGWTANGPGAGAGPSGAVPVQPGPALSPAGGARRGFSGRSSGRRGAGRQGIKTEAAAGQAERLRRGGPVVRAAPAVRRSGSRGSAGALPAAGGKAAASPAASRGGEAASPRR